MQPPRELLLLCRRLVTFQSQASICNISNPCVRTGAVVGTHTHQQSSLVNQHRQLSRACTTHTSSRKQQGLPLCHTQLQQQLAYLHSLHNGSNCPTSYHQRQPLRLSSFSSSNTASQGSIAASSDVSGAKSTSSTPKSSTDTTAPAGSHVQSPKLQIPPAIAAAATGIGAAAASAGKATVKQVSKVLRLIQQTSVLQAAHLQLSSLWQSHSTAITMLGAAAATAGLSQITIAAAGLFSDVSTTEALLTCTAVSAAAVGGVGLQLRSGLVVDPERVYQVALRKLTNHAGLQEVMGTPLAGSAMRVQLVTRGSYFIQETLLPKRRAPRIHMLFPLTGPLRSGVVSLEAKKEANGKYAFKHLLVELPNKALVGAKGMAVAIEAAAKAQEQIAGASFSAAAAEAAAEADAAAIVSNDCISCRIDQEQESARIYIVGNEQAMSQQSISSLDTGATSAAKQDTVPSARALLEQLKHPLMLALEQNIVVYEAEDELEDLGRYTVLESDPEQLTVLDRARQGMYVAAAASVQYGKVAGCRLVGSTRRLAAALKQKAAVKQSTKSAITTSSVGGTAAATVPRSVAEAPAASAAPVVSSQSMGKPASETRQI